jgi:hypothetical protein
VATALAKTKSNKAPEPDGLPNRVLKLATRKLLRELTRLFSAYLRLIYQLKTFREATTIILRKLEKEDYFDSIAYRSIALLNTIGKVLELIVTRRISDLTKKHTLLLDT